ncbi:MAG: hypothetical protein KGI84_04010, partial [Elusimicrobia bacterium]|nr:hypothetical protein [Elusimicrobiota bacterium]
MASKKIVGALSRALFPLIAAAGVYQIVQISRSPLPELSEESAPADAPDGRQTAFQSVRSAAALSAPPLPSASDSAPARRPEYKDAPAFVPSEPHPAGRAPSDKSSRWSSWSADEAADAALPRAGENQNTLSKSKRWKISGLGGTKRQGGARTLGHRQEFSRYKRGDSEENQEFPPRKRRRHSAFGWRSISAHGVHVRAELE